MAAWNIPHQVELREIKSQALSEQELEEMQRLAGSYEALFSKRAQLYKSRGLGQQDLKEADYRDLLLEHYTFLKRPVLVYEDHIFIGNAKKTAAAVQAFLAELN